jgi:guanine deaminase
VDSLQSPFMTRAIALSLESIRSGRGGPFAALVVKQGQILGEGTNQVTATSDPSAHAEVVAIRLACRRLNHFQLTGCEIYTTCEPCPMCLGLIYWARPQRVYYANTAEDAAAIGFDDSLIYEEIKLPRNERAIPMVQIMRDQAVKVFRAWKEMPNKVRY